MSDAGTKKANVTALLAAPASTKTHAAGRQ
jgi:hypothetical protein